MKTLALVAGALLCASAAPAEDAPLDTSQSYDSRYSSAMPPERFRQEGVAIVLFVSDVTAYCGASEDPRYHIIACKREMRDGTPVVIMPHPIAAAEAGESYALLLTHELGHVAGWPGDHPG